MHSKRTLDLLRLSTVGWLFALIACPVWGIDMRLNVPDWEDDEISFSVVVTETAAVDFLSVPDLEDDEMTFQYVELDTPESKDIDLFSFVLKHRSTVQLETRGEANTYGQLLDQAFSNLETDDNSGVGKNFKIVETLNAGRYFLGVAGGKAGKYSLSVTVSTPSID